MRGRVRYNPQGCLLPAYAARFRERAKVVPAARVYSTRRLSRETALSRARLLLRESMRSATPASFIVVVVGTECAVFALAVSPLRVHSAVTLPPGGCVCTCLRAHPITAGARRGGGNAPTITAAENYLVRGVLLFEHEPAGFPRVLPLAGTGSRERGGDGVMLP